MIYALLEPDTGAVRYVGKTRLALEHRVNLHVNGARRSLRPTPCEAWVLELLARGERPDAVVLDEACTSVDEHRWINEYRTQGAALLNVYPVVREPRTPRIKREPRVRVRKGYASGPASAETKARMAEAQQTRRARERANQSSSKEVVETYVHDRETGVL